MRRTKYELSNGAAHLHGRNVSMRRMMSNERIE